MMRSIATHSILLLLLLVIASGFTIDSKTVGRRAASRSALYAEEDTQTPSAADVPRPASDVKCPNCDLCDGSGRIAGGIGAVFSWIPIKAYRPCPNFVKGGGIYEKRGQGLSEIAFGRDSTFDPNE